MLRKQRGCTQEILAEAANLSASYLSHIERGDKKASLSTLVQIAAALSVPVDRLLSGNQPSVPVAVLPEIQDLLEDASAQERRFLYEAVKAIRESLRNNHLIA